MAFVNKVLTKEEREEFKARQIIDFRRSWPGDITILDPYRWTIDEERGVILHSLDKEREEPDFEYFTFIIGDTIANIILNRKTQDHLKIQNPNILIWSINKVDFQNENTIPEDQFYGLLKDALREYRWDGLSDVWYNKCADVKFEF